MVELLKVPYEVQPYCWLIRLGQAECGVHEQNGWCIQTKSGVVYCDSKENCMPLLPILELDKNAFFHFLEEKKKENPVYNKAIDSFPVESVLQYAFEDTISGYWPELALNWILNNKHMQSLLRPSLIQLNQNKSMPQSLRHKAKRLVLQHD